MSQHRSYIIWWFNLDNNEKRKKVFSLLLVVCIFMMLYDLCLYQMDSISAHTHTLAHLLLLHATVALIPVASHSCLDVFFLRFFFFLSSGAHIHRNKCRGIFLLLYHRLCWWRKIREHKKRIIAASRKHIAHKYVDVHWLLWRTQKTTKRGYEMNKLGVTGRIENATRCWLSLLKLS